MKGKGKIAWFGGPDDKGVSPSEHLALYWQASQIVLMPELFLPHQPVGTTGLARRLDPDALYCACRWDYDEAPKNVLRNSVVRVTSPSSTIFCRPADWGPHTGTGRNIDVSPGAMRALNVKTDDVVEYELITGKESIVIPPATGKRVMILIGHHPDDQGAENYNGISEFEFNSPLAIDIASRMKKNHAIVTSRPRTRWTERDINSVINAQNPVAVIELHANSFNGRVSGTEMLYWNRSTESLNLARKLQGAVVLALELNDRGLKSRTYGDRGALFLYATKMPAVICESFFIDNNSDLNTATLRKADLAQAYAEVMDAL